MGYNRPVAASVSLVIPCYNEEESLPALAEEIDRIVLELGAVPLLWRLRLARPGRAPAE